MNKDDEINPALARALYQVGWSNYLLGNGRASLDYLNRAYNMRLIMFSSANHVDMAQSLFGIGAVYNLLGDYESELEFSMRSLEMRKSYSVAIILMLQNH